MFENVKWWVAQVRRRQVSPWEVLRRSKDKAPCRLCPSLSAIDFSHPSVVDSFYICKNGLTLSVWPPPQATYPSQQPLLGLDPLKAPRHGHGHPSAQGRGWPPSAGFVAAVKRRWPWETESPASNGVSTARRGRISEKHGKTEEIKWKSKENPKEI